MEQRRRRRPAPSTPWAPDSGSKKARTPLFFSHKIPSHCWRDPLAESVYSTFRVKPDTEPVPLPLVQCHALPSTVIPGHLNLIKSRPSGPFLHLVNHVLEFDGAYVAAKEHALSFDLFPVVAPCCLADRAAFLSYFQTVYSSPNGPSNTGRKSRSIGETWPAHRLYSHIIWNISPRYPGPVRNGTHPHHT